MRIMLLALVGLTTACTTTDEVPDGQFVHTGETASPQPTGDTAVEHTGDTSPPAELDLIGDWIDNWGTDLVITADEITSPWSSQGIHSYDNEAQSLLAVDTTGEADVWYRYDWTMVDGSYWLCTAVYDGTSAEDAAGRPDSDRAAYDVDGCSGFAFSQLLEPIAIRGAWTGPGEMEITISKTAFTTAVATASIAAWDNDAMYFVVNGSDDFMVTDMHTRMDWTWQGDDLYTCETSTEPGTLAEAEALSRPDDAAPSTGGCHEGPWMLLTPAAND